MMSGSREQIITVQTSIKAQLKAADRATSLSGDE